MAKEFMTMDEYASSLVGNVAPPVKKKGMAKGGTNKKRAVSRKPRGVGVALRGFGKALKK